MSRADIMMSCLGPRSSPGEDGGQFMAGMNGVLIVLLTFIAVRAGDTTHTTGSVIGEVCSGNQK